MQTATNRKATKTQLDAAVRSFLYRYDSLTGGTREEVARQAPAGIVGLEELADAVYSMAANCNKAATGDEHLMRYASEVIPGKLSLYRRRVPGTAEHAEAEREAADELRLAERQFAVYQASERLILPDNVIPFPRVA